MSKCKLCQFGKEIKKKLVDIDRSQEWLISEVSKRSGLYFDRSYLSKIMTGKIETPKVVACICKVLGIEVPAKIAS